MGLDETLAARDGLLLEPRSGSVNNVEGERRVSIAAAGSSSRDGGEESRSHCEGADHRQQSNRNNNKLQGRFLPLEPFLDGRTKRAIGNELVVF